MDRPFVRALFSDGERLRPVWRIVVFFFFFFLLFFSGQFAVSALPRSPLQWGSVVAATLAALLSGWIMLSRLDQRPPGALGFPLHRRAPLEILAGLALGGVLIGVAILLLLVSGAARFVPDAGAGGDYLYFLTWSLVYFGIAAALEEAIFRGYPFQVLVEWIGVWPGILLSSAVFALLHGQNPNVTPFALVNIFLAGVLLSLAYLRTLSLWFATAVHLGWNWTMAALFDFPVSGLTEFDTPLYSAVPRGPAFWTGGGFGPEAGFAATITLLLGIFWFLRSPRIRPAPETLRLRPLPKERLHQKTMI